MRKEATGLTTRKSSAGLRLSVTVCALKGRPVKNENEREKIKIKMKRIMTGVSNNDYKKEKQTQNANLTN